MQIYEIENDSNDDLTEGQQRRTDFWTQWAKARVG